jgi:hypothetical protein
MGSCSHINAEIQRRQIRSSVVLSLVKRLTHSRIMLNKSLRLLPPGRMWSPDRPSPLPRWLFFVICHVFTLIVRVDQLRIVIPPGSMLPFFHFGPLPVREIDCSFFFLSCVVILLIGIGVSYSDIQHP